MELARRPAARMVQENVSIAQHLSRRCCLSRQQKASPAASAPGELLPALTRLVEGGEEALGAVAAHVLQRGVKGHRHDRFPSMPALPLSRGHVYLMMPRSPYFPPLTPSRTRLAISALYLPRSS